MELQAQRATDALPAAFGTGADRLASGERWAIWRRQIASGREPCFATPERFGCTELRCPWRARCLALRAEWLR